MAKKPINVLKTFYETGDRPTQAQFEDLIDSFIHKDTGVVIIGKEFDQETGVLTLEFSDSTALNVPIPQGFTIAEIEGLIDALDSKVDKEVGKGLSTNDYTAQEKAKVQTAEDHVNDGTIHVSAGDRENWDGKQDAEAGKGLSTNDYTDAEAAAVASVTPHIENQQIHTSQAEKDFFGNKVKNWETGEELKENVGTYYRFFNGNIYEYIGALPFTTVDLEAELAEDPTRWGEKIMIPEALNTSDFVLKTGEDSQSIEGNLQTLGTLKAGEHTENDLDKKVGLVVSGKFQGGAAERYRVIGFSGVSDPTGDIFTETDVGGIRNFYIGTFSVSHNFQGPRFSIVNSGVEILTASHNENVGIGINLPTEKLDVNGNLKAKKLLVGGDLAKTNGIVVRGSFPPGSKYRVISFAGTNDPPEDIFTETGVGDFRNFHIGTFSSSNNFNSPRFSIVNSTVEILTALQNGNIGIGNTNPSEKLEVNGNIKALGFDFSEIGSFTNDTTAAASGLTPGMVYFNTSIRQLVAIGKTQQKATGWSSHTGGQYTSASPLAVVGNSTYVNLPNDSAVTIDTYKPIDIPKLYDEITQKVTGREGDSILVGVSFAVRPTTSTATSVTIIPDIGGAIGEIAEYAKDQVFAKGQNVEQRFYHLFDAFTLDTWEANGAQLKVKANAAVEIYSIRYKITVITRG